MLGFLQGGGTTEDDEGSIEISLAGLFKCMLCTHQKAGDEKAQLINISESLEALMKRLDHIEKYQINIYVRVHLLVYCFCRAVDPHGHSSRKRSMSASSKADHHLGAVPEEGSEESENESDSETSSTIPRNKRDDLVNPYWIEDPELRKGEVEFLSSNEIQFWKDLLDKYLYPIDEDKAEKVISVN